MLLLIGSWHDLPDIISTFDDTYGFQAFAKGRLAVDWLVANFIHVGFYILSRLPRLLVEPLLLTEHNRIAQFKVARRSHFIYRMQLVLLLNGVIIGEILVALEQIKAVYVVAFKKILIVSIVMNWGFSIYQACRHR